ncbi:hypothetical protein GCM10025794_36300 [Massilia kyonggiensis]
MAVNYDRTLSKNKDEKRRMIAALYYSGILHKARSEFHLLI